MKTFTDQMGREVNLETTPKRIISIVPSQTQLLHYLGLDQEVVGITKFCIHPNSWYQKKTRVGGTKKLDIDKIEGLKPDLIIGNKEENSKEDIQALEKIAPVWMSDIYTLEDAQGMIASIGDLLNKSEEVKTLLDKITTQFALLSAKKSCLDSFNKTVLYFIWHDPDMIAGPNTFIHDMLNKCGFENLAPDSRYPEAPIDVEPDFILLSTEPFPFTEKHMDHFSTNYPNSQIVFVDGEMFSWYGSRLVEAPAYFMSLLKQIIQVIQITSKK